ncbi:uncharacterized protein LOC109834107 [Asparagus officinalis]|uniref:uncharacterized protein LOC109834107 n=1 Tax=Asparagus officinalis TaxID=4686 RepID=UPI00098E73D3|nr:uncharacterized protein LOC109834107 [Asparagus officinalis]
MEFRDPGSYSAPPHLYNPPAAQQNPNLHQYHQSLIPQPSSYPQNPNPNPNPNPVHAKTPFYSRAPAAASPTWLLPPGFDRYPARTLLSARGAPSPITRTGFLMLAIPNRPPPLVTTICSTSSSRAPMELLKLGLQLQSWRQKGTNLLRVVHHQNQLEYARYAISCATVIRCLRFILLDKCMPTRPLEYHSVHQS